MCKPKPQGRLLGGILAFHLHDGIIKTEQITAFRAMARVRPRAVSRFKAREVARIKDRTMDRVRAKAVAIVTVRTMTWVRAKAVSLVKG